MSLEDRENLTDDWSPMPPEKKERRRFIVAKSLAGFVSSFNATSKRKNDETEYLLDYQPYHCEERSTKIVWFYDAFRRMLSDVVVHGEGNRLIDRHKIIAGKQTAIMMVLPLRTQKYTHIDDHQLNEWYQKYDHPELINLKSLSTEDTPFVETILVNARFAFFLGVDILCIWNGLEQNAAGFMADNRSLCSCYPRLLLNTFRRRGSASLRDSSFFWCSHLWYALEKNLLCWSKRGKE